jgi:glutamate/tyrosine decarboxylase-like PLP-dependent enzyme
MTQWLKDAAQYSINYVETVHQQAVFPKQAALDALQIFEENFPESPTSTEEIVHLLDEFGSPATVATTGGRYFGFVQGALLPAAMVASWFMTVWDQNSALRVMTPIGAKLEEIAESWLLDALDLPRESSVGFVTGATMANFTGLVAARHYLLERAGWDVEAKGLFGAPEIKVVVGDEVHMSMQKALMMVGFGHERVIRVPCDEQGRMRADALPELDEMTLIAIQAGNVNTGAFDPAQAICEVANAAGAWVHVDGAFGLWARAVPERQHLSRGYELADSWALDGHKWLNVSYDNGLLVCKHDYALRAALSLSAPYLLEDAERQPYHYTPEASRRARGIEIWAALKSLGRQGLAEMIEHDCQMATRFAEGLQKTGFTVLNDVVINQILVTFGDAETTLRTIKAIQAEGTMWAGQTVWQGHTAMRISVSSWNTTAEDIDRCIEAIRRVAREQANS